MFSAKRIFTRAESSLRRSGVDAWIYLLIFILYGAFYLSYPAVPGSGANGWWGWWDQSHYLKSAQAFARGKFSPDFHWYPPGYALLAAPLLRAMPLHAFFLVDGLLLLACSALFLAICRHLAVGRRWAVIALLAGLFLSRSIFVQYVVPWTTTPAMALLLGIVLLYLKIRNGSLTPLRGALVSACVVGLGITRPTDVLCLFPIAIHILILTVQRTRLQSVGDRTEIAGLITAILSGLFLIGCAILLHVRIYGWSLSPYQSASSQFGLDTRLIPFRFYVIFISPTAFYGEGRGIIAEIPLVAIGLISLLYCIVFVRRYAVLPLTIILYTCVYLSYPDFLPSGLWRFLNIHYLKWIFPMLALFTVMMIRDLLVAPKALRFAFLGAIILPALMLKLAAVDLSGTSQRVNAQEIMAELPEPAWVSAARIDHAPGGFQETNFSWGARLDADGTVLRHIIDYRMIPVGDVIYLVLNKPILARKVSVSLEANTSLGPDSHMVLVENGIGLRTPKDWKREPYVSGAP